MRRGGAAAYAVVFVLFALVALAGCTGQEDTASSVELLGERFGTAVTGVVLNEELAPVEGAVVAVADQGSATTGEDGAFRILDVEPGTYTVVVEAAGYHAAERDVRVVEGQPAVVDFTLTRAPSTQPYHEVFPYVGYEACSLVLGVFVYGPPTIPCSEETNTNFPFTMAATWQYLVVEMDWKTPDSMWLIMTPDVDGASCNTGADNWCWSVLGGAPLRMAGGPNDTAAAARYALDGESPIPGGEQHLQLGTTYAGMYRETVNDTAGDQCNLAISAGLGVLGQKWNENLGCGLGYGYSAGVRINFYTSIFHHAAPAAPEAYTALPDE